MSRFDDNDPFDNLINSGAKGFAKLAGIALLVNLLFWGAIIAMVIFGLTFVF